MTITYRGVTISVGPVKEVVREEVHDPDAQELIYVEITLIAER